MPIYPYSFTLPPVNKQDIPSNGVAGEFLGINGGGQLDWLPVSGGSGSGDLLAANNLSELTPTAGTARTNLGLGTGDSPTFANLTLTSPSLGSSAPVTISQTWNAGTNVMTALKVVATDTASGSTSNLLELWAGSTPTLKAWATKSGGFRASTGQFNSGNGIGFAGGLSTGFYSVAGEQIFVAANNTVPIEFKSTSIVVASTVTFGFGTVGVGADTILLRDGAANTLALRNGALAQTFNVYGTYSTSPSLAYSRLAIACDTSGNATLTTQSTGTAGTVSINGVPVGLGKGNVSTNMAIGPSALNANTTGSRNVAIGNESLLFVTTGLANTAIGAGSLKAAGATSIANTAIGDLALTYCATSTYNTAIGQGAGTFVLSGSTLSNSSYSVFIGTDAKANSNSETNQIAIGHQAQGIGSNSVVLGNDSITKTALKGNVGIGTTSPSSKLHVAETWNNAGTSFTAMQVAVTNTSSTSGSKLFDLLSGTVTPTSKFSVDKDGIVSISAYAFGDYLSKTNKVRIGNNSSDAAEGVFIGSSSYLGFVTSSPDPNLPSTSRLYGDGAYAIGQRNGTNGQTFSVYGTYPGAAWERFTITAPTSGNVLLGTYRGTGGIARGLEIQTDGVSRWTISTAGHLLAAADNTYDIGASGASRPRNLFIAGSADVAGTFACPTIYAGSTGNATALTTPTNGVFRITNNSATDFTRLQLGGSADTFPAIARDGAGIKFTGAAAGSTSWIKVPPVAVSALPAAATAGAGARAFVNDATAPVFGSAVSGGGAVLVPVYSTGSAWNVG